jgi:hypothetical protein
MKRVIISMASLVAIFRAPIITCAQSCALCYQSAASSGPQLIQALRSGILILLVPPLLIGIGFAWLAYRKRSSFRTPEVESMKSVARSGNEIVRSDAIPVEQSVL